MPCNIQRKTYQNYPRLLTRDDESLSFLGRSHSDSKRTQMLAQTTIHRKPLKNHRWRNQEKFLNRESIAYALRIRMG